MDLTRAERSRILAGSTKPLHRDRVELIPSGNVNDPDPYLARTAEEITIPAGAVIHYTVETPPEDGPPWIS